MADIFVSYKRTDKSKVAPIVVFLESKGWTVWWDTRIGAGETWDQVIERELAVARCVVVVWSIESIGSRWVRAEASEGLERGILIPVHIDIARPPLEFKLIQSLDFSNWLGGCEASANELADAVGKLVGRPEAPVGSPHPAQEDQFELPQVLKSEMLEAASREVTKTNRYLDILMGVWLVLGLLLGWAMLVPEIARIGFFGALGSPVTIIAAATIFLPVALFWFLGFAYRTLRAWAATS